MRNVRLSTLCEPVIPGLACSLAGARTTITRGTIRSVQDETHHNQQDYSVEVGVER